MAKENKVEYERVDEEGDEYKRILVKFNPHSLRGSDFEIEFIPISEARGAGHVFISEIDSMSSIDLYRWMTRIHSLQKGGENWERGYIPTIDENKAVAEKHMKMWRKGELQLEPRQIISQVKRMYEVVEEALSPPAAYLYNYFLYSGRLGSMPLYNRVFTIERLQEVIEDFHYRCKNSNGEMVSRPLVEHLFDTHKTKYVEGTILSFIYGMCYLVRKTIEKVKEEVREEQQR